MTKARILIVDDQEEILDSLKAILSDEGHEVITARDGQEALHIVQSDAPDVVFLDIWIPGIDGMQTLKAIKRITPQSSVIMMSGHGTIETAVKAIKLGATDYLEKPLNLEDVLHLVQKAVTSRAQTSRSNQREAMASHELIGNSEKVLALRTALERAASEAGSVWLAGEKGTGKEFLARIIHYLEGKERSGLVKVRCTELTEENAEEILLGKEDGANRSKLGRMSRAGGTLLLIRVDRLDPAVGRKLPDLLRKHAGSDVSKSGRAASGLRVISTSIFDPETLVREGKFPEVLAELMGQQIVRVPTLRERAEDIPLFVSHFLKEASEEFDRDISGIDEEAMARLMDYPWPGNVKELKILIEHVVMTAPGPRITVNDLLIPAGHEGRAIELPHGAVSRQKDAEKRYAGVRPDVVPGNGGTEAAGVASTNISVEAPFHYQKTLRGRVVMYGQGLHSGTKTGLTLSPLPPFSGILFGHITSGGSVPALLGNVESTQLSTCLRQNGTFARTIEHLMAVFHMYGLTNVLVKISGEVPIMDGSALEFCRLVESAEIILQDELVEEVRITEPFEFPFPAGSPKSMRVEPSDSLQVEYYLDYPPPVGSMHLIFQCNGPGDFKEQIAPARTFGFVKDMRMMDEMGLAGGGRLSNVVLLDEEKVVNPPLRFEDEFVRHKILDIIGDFYLLGRPFIGKIIARQTGHTENIAMLKLINEKMKIV
jgi:UDP-3-O-acyl N-acetylglucosamine deacetylase